MTTNQPVQIPEGRPFRQGDVGLAPVAALPEDAKPVSRDKHGHFVLALGEHSGHRHAFREDSDVTAWAIGKEGIDFIEVGSGGARLNHDYLSGAMADHHGGELAPGVYQVIRQREFISPAIERRVED